MSKKGSKNIPTSDRPVVLRPSKKDDSSPSSYVEYKTATNKKIANHKHRSGWSPLKKSLLYADSTFFISIPYSFVIGSLNRWTCGV